MNVQTLLDKKQEKESRWARPPANQVSDHPTLGLTGPAAPRYRKVTMLPGVDTSLAARALCVRDRTDCPRASLLH